MDSFQTLDEVVRAHMLHAIRVAGGDIVEAARLLDIGKSTLYKRLKKFPIDKYLEARRGGR